MQRHFSEFSDPPPDFVLKFQNASSRVIIYKNELNQLQKDYNAFFKTNRAIHTDYLNLPNKIKAEQKKCILENKNYKSKMLNILSAPNPDLEFLDTMKKSWQEKLISIQAIVQNYEKKYAECKAFIETYVNHSRAKVKEINKSLLSAKEDLEKHTILSKQALFNAITDNEIKKIDAILNAGLSIESKNAEGLTPLFYAIKTNNIQLVQRFLDAGANPNLEIQVNNAPSMTPMIATVIWTFNNTQILQLLINNGAILDHRNNQHNTALHVAISMLAIDHAIFLLKQGANCNLYNFRRETPLNILEKRKHIFWHKEIKTVVDELKNLNNRA